MTETVQTFKEHADVLSNKFKSIDVTVSSFKRHVCVDCGVHISKFSAKRCKSCNMRIVGKSRNKKLRKQRREK